MNGPAQKPVGNSDWSERVSPGAGRKRSLFGAIWPSLAFEPGAEAEFRRWYSSNVRTRVRHVMWLSMGYMLAITIACQIFPQLRYMLFGTKYDAALQVAGVFVMVPTCVALLLVTYTRLYERWFRPTVQVVAYVHVLCIVAFDILMQPQGYSLSAWMPLVAMTAYFLYGMLQAEAVRISFTVVIAYAVAGYVAELRTPNRLFDLIAVAFAACVGAIIHYSLQKAIRTNYLATRTLSESANRDPLTGIRNRRMFDEHIALMWQQAQREHVPLALLMVDIDHFKAFNDRRGHQAGDATLIRVAETLSRAARRPLDLTARYGGEEFAVLLYDMRRDRVEDLCRQLHAGVAMLDIEHPMTEQNRHLTISIGAACIEPRPGRQVEGFIQLADEALYSAKERGRNRTVIMDREYETLETGVFRVHGSAA